MAEPKREPRMIAIVFDGPECIAEMQRQQDVARRNINLAKRKIKVSEDKIAECQAVIDAARAGKPITRYIKA